MNQNFASVVFVMNIFMLTHSQKRERHVRCMRRKIILTGGQRLVIALISNINLLKINAMSLSITELAKARESVSKILEELQLDAYLYEVEPRDDTWELKIECACEVDGGWETIILQVPKRMLLDSFDDETAKQHLFEFWQKKFANCKLRQPSSDKEDPDLYLTIIDLRGEHEMIWPNDADGDVFRSLEEDGFDFLKDHSVEFNVDFEHWPPSPEAISLLKEKYENLEILEPTDGFDGYIKIQISAKLSYELVTGVQRDITNLIRNYGAKCESWDVMNG